MNLNVSCDRSFALRAQNPNIADVIFQVEPEIKIFWLPISLLFISKIILKQLFAFGSVNVPQYLLRLRRIIVKYSMGMWAGSSPPEKYGYDVGFFCE